MSDLHEIPDELTVEADEKDGLIRRFLTRLRNYFFAGILVTAPITLTIYLAWSFITFVDDRVGAIIPNRYAPENYLPFEIPGLGILILIILLTFIGAMTAGYLGRMFIRVSEYILDKMPILRSVYGATKQIIETVFASKSRAFREVVMVEYPRLGCWSVGFVTGNSKGQIQNAVDDDLVNVFVPTTPNPTSGYILFLPRSELYQLDMSVEEGVKLVVSAGIITPPDKRPIDQQKAVLTVDSDNPAQVPKDAQPLGE
jgi:uncharacterized membrane protein